MSPISLIRRIFSLGGSRSVDRVGRSYPHPAEEMIAPELRPYLENHNWRNLRYPPYQEGYPGLVAGRWFMRRYQQDLFDRLMGSVGLPDEEFARYVEPILNNFAELAHLLPASQSHHHDGPGGLLRHSMEVAAFTLDGCLTTAFDAGETPSRRSMRLRRWYVAGVAAGLLHDAGKPLSDIRATSFDGAEEWNYERETLHAWSSRTGINRYFLHWNPDRHANHVQVSVSLVRGIIPDEARAWIRDGGHDIYEAMLDAISGAGAGPLTPLVRAADEASVKRDLLKGPRNTTGGDTGVPVARLVTDAMLRLVENGTWKANTPGGRIWIATDGIYIAWTMAAEEIVQMVVADGVVAIPRAADTLVGILAAHGIAERASNGDVYWYVTPHLLRKNGQAPALRCIKLVSPDILFPLTPLPPPVSISLGKEGKARDLIAPNDKLGEQASQKNENQGDLFQQESTTSPAQAVDSGEEVVPVADKQTKPKRKKAASLEIGKPSPGVRAGAAAEEAPPSVAVTEPAADSAEDPKELEEEPEQTFTLEQMLGDLSQLPDDTESGASSGASVATESPPGGLSVEDAQEQRSVTAAAPELTVRPGRISLSQLRGDHSGAAPESAPQVATAAVPVVAQVDQPAQPEKVAVPAPLEISPGDAELLADHEIFLLQKHPELARKLIAAAAEPETLRSAFNKVFVRLGSAFQHGDVEDLVQAGWLWQDIASEGPAVLKKLKNQEGFLLTQDYSLIVCKLARLDWNVPHLSRLPTGELPLLRNAVEQVIARSSFEVIAGLGLRAITPHQLSQIAEQFGVSPALLEEAIFALRDAVKVAVKRKIFIRALPEEIPAK